MARVRRYFQAVFPLQQQAAMSRRRINNDDLTKMLRPALLGICAVSARTSVLQMSIGRFHTYDLKHTILPAIFAITPSQ
jgi:hypothetical protein